MKLYHVTTIAPELEGYRDVSVHWFVYGRGVLEEPAESIEDFDPGDDSLLATFELFDAAEAEALANWLKDNGAGEATIKEVELPLPRTTYPMRAMPAGGGTDFLIPKNLLLPPSNFSPSAYVDFRRCERIAEDAK